MEKNYHVTLDDAAPLPTEDDMKAFAEKIGITYDEYDDALDNGIFKTADVLAYVKEKCYHVMIDDGAPLLPVTEEELRADAKKLGISYEDYLSALDNHIPYNEIYEYVKKLHK